MSTPANNNNNNNNGPTDHELTLLLVLESTTISSPCLSLETLEELALISEAFHHAVTNHDEYWKAKYERDFPNSLPPERLVETVGYRWLYEQLANPAPPASRLVEADAVSVPVPNDDDEIGPLVPLPPPSCQPEDIVLILKLSLGGGHVEILYHTTDKKIEVIFGASRPSHFLGYAFVASGAVDPFNGLPEDFKMSICMFRFSDMAFCSIAEMSSSNGNFRIDSEQAEECEFYGDDYDTFVFQNESVLGQQLCRRFLEHQFYLTASIMTSFSNGYARMFLGWIDDQGRDRLERESISSGEEFTLMHLLSELQPSAIFVPTPAQLAEQHD